MTSTAAAPTPFIPRGKDTVDIPVAAPYLSFDTLSGRLLSPTPTPQPSTSGTVSLLVQRPAINARAVVPSAYLSVAQGMHGSGWVENPQRGTMDQICVMSTAAIRAIAGEDEDRWPAAGDQIFMDFDLGEANLRVGDRVRVGEEVELEVTRKPHLGCAKFAKRYGADALKVVNVKLGRERRLRGIYFRVVKEGMIHKGDVVARIDGPGSGGGD